MIKRVFIISGLILLALVAALIAAVVLIDPNDHRDRIEALAAEATGRELRIVDDLELSIFPWIGVAAGEVRLGNAADFGPEPFARIGSAQVKVRVIPLLSGKVEIDTVVLHGLEVRLAVTADGRNNWDDLAGTPAPGHDGSNGEQPQPPPPGSGAPPAAALPAMLTVGGLDIRDAAVYWRDESAGNEFDVTGITLRSGRIAPDRPVDLTLDFGFRSGEPEVDGTVSIETRLTARPADEFFMAENLRVRTRLDGKPLPAPATFAFAGNVGIDLGRETVELPSFTIEVYGQRMSGSLRGQEILDGARISGTLEATAIRPRELLEAVGAGAPATADPATLDRASLALSFAVDPEQARFEDIVIGLDDSTLRGTATVRNFDAPLPAIAFDLALDGIDIDRYLPPGEETPPATPATAPAAAIQLPLETLRALDVDGALAADRLKAAGVTLTDFRMRARARDGVIAITPIAADLYGGRYTGNLRLDARRDVPAFSIDEALAGVQAEPLLKDMLDLDLVSGIADFRLRANARGTTDEQLRESLDGNASFSFRDGAVRGFNTAQMIREASARLKGRAPPPDVAQETDFTELSGTIRIADGTARNDDLRANSPYLRLGGSGQVDLVRERIDYRLRARIVDTAAGQGGAGLDDVKGVDIPVRISGALAAPDIRIDSDFLRNLLRDKLAPQVEELRQELEQKADEKKQELKRETDEKKQELKQELQDKVDQQLRKLLR